MKEDNENGTKEKNKSSFNFRPVSHIRMRNFVDKKFLNHAWKMDVKQIEVVVEFWFRFSRKIDSTDI